MLMFLLSNLNSTGGKAESPGGKVYDCEASRDSMYILPFTWSQSSWILRDSFSSTRFVSLSLTSYLSIVHP
jgi:hypothetical protein